MDLLEWQEMAGQLGRAWVTGTSDIVRVGSAAAGVGVVGAVDWRVRRGAAEIFEEVGESRGVHVQIGS